MHKKAFECFSPFSGKTKKWLKLNNCNPLSDLFIKFTAITYISHRSNLMSDLETITNENQAEEQSFAAMLADYDNVSSPKIKKGDKVNGKIIEIGTDSIFVSTGAKIDGVVDITEFTKDGKLTVAEGDEVELYVVKSGETEIRLSKAISGQGDMRAIQEAYDSKVPVVGRVTGTCKGGLHVEVMKKRAFCPASQIDTKFVEDLAPYVGKEYKFIITQFEPRARNIVVSRKTILLEELSKNRDEFLKTNLPGTIIDGIVTKIMPYGAFVELAPGIEGMVHISEISWSRVDDTNKFFTTSQKIKVMIMGIEEGKREGDVRISLSIKKVEGDPWDNVESKFSVDQVVTGKVTRTAPFGAFVQITPGIEGLVHISEMSYVKRVLKPEEIVEQGDEVSVMIKEIDKSKRRISLSIKEVDGDPWDTIEVTLKKGQVIEGTVEKVETFGIFIKLTPGISGLLPNSSIKRASDPSEFENLKPQDTVKVKINDINIDDKKISLAPATEQDSENWQEYSDATPEEEDSSLGNFGAKLAEALAKKE